MKKHKPLVFLALASLAALILFAAFPVVPIGSGVGLVIAVVLLAVVYLTNTFME
jgi:hypothetical protein